MKKLLERLRRWAAGKLERARRWAIRKLGGYVIACVPPAAKSVDLVVREFWAVDYFQWGQGAVPEIWSRGFTRKDMEGEIMRQLREAGAISWQEAEDWMGDTMQLRAKLVVIMPEECRP